MVDLEGAKEKMKVQPSEHPLILVNISLLNLIHFI